jgi:hypothetical protein
MSSEGVMESLGFVRKTGTNTAFDWSDPTTWGDGLRGVGVDSDFAGERVFIPGNPGMGKDAPPPDQVKSYNIAHADDFRDAGFNVSAAGDLSRNFDWKPETQRGYQAPQVKDTIFGPIVPDTFRREAAQGFRDVFNPITDSLPSVGNAAFVVGAVFVGGLTLLLLLRR